MSRPASGYSRCGESTDCAVATVDWCTTWTSGSSRTGGGCSCSSGCFATPGRRLDHERGGWEEGDLMAYTGTIERPQCRRCAKTAVEELERHEAADKALTVGRLRIPAISEKSRRLPEITT